MKYGCDESLDKPSGSILFPGYFTFFFCRWLSHQTCLQLQTKLLPVSCRTLLLIRVHSFFFRQIHLFPMYLGVYSFFTLQKGVEWGHFKPYCLPVLDFWSILHCFDWPVESAKRFTHNSAFTQRSRWHTVCILLHSNQSCSWTGRTHNVVLLWCKNMKRNLDLIVYVKSKSLFDFINFGCAYGPFELL